MQKAKTLLIAALLMSIPVFTGGANVFAQTTTTSIHVPLQAALDAMNSDSQVTVATVAVPTWSGGTYYSPQFYYEFTPTSGTPTEGLIFYPGANVDERAYSKICHAIAAAGYLVALVPMPDWMAFYGINRADAVISNHPAITKWSIGGHSFGAVGACWYITSPTAVNKGKINNIVLMAGYPAESIAAQPVKVVSIWGTNDGLTDSADINASKANLPADTVYTALTGANHTQFGYYANSSDNDSFIQKNDNPATITRDAQHNLIVSNTIKFMSNVPPALETITATDGSSWERVNMPGFADTNNISIVAMAEYKGSMYALTRNQAQGCEVWRTTGTGWEQVLFPGGVTNGVYGNTSINNVWARMIVFNGKLYFGLSAGLQGNYLGSTGSEIWRYDGATWEPVVSDLKDIDAAGSITGIDSCGNADGSATATITDSSRSWTVDQWAGGVLQITSGTGKYRKFRIISNTATTLTIQQNESAGTYNSSGQETESTVCASQTYNNPFPAYSYSVGAVTVGNTYEIGQGTDENGFGDFWNKTITAMRIFNNQLYVSTGLNYEYGGQIWYTADGDTWDVTDSKINIPLPYANNSFGNYHASTTYPGGYKPVSSSVTDLIVSSVSGTPVLYAGGTGTSGNLGGCSRMAKLTNDGWELIVDGSVDANATGSNENGFGSPVGCGTNQYNFMPWSLADFNNMLMVGISGAGARVIYNDTGSSEDGSWHYSVGTGNVNPADPTYVDPLGTSSYLNGFDGYTYTDGNWQNLAVNLAPIGTTLWAGIILQYAPEYAVPPSLDQVTGSQIWKSTDGHTWSQVTNNGFGDTNTIIFEAFAEFEGQIYVSGSKGSSATPSGLGGAKIYRQVPAAPVTYDTDFDGIENSVDNCPAIANPQQLDADDDDIGDACDTTPGCGGCGQPVCEGLADSDGDYVLDINDNCPDICNYYQLDADDDGIGDACDTGFAGCAWGAAACGLPVCEEACR